MKYIVLGCVAAALLVGCNLRDDRIAFEGHYFRAKLSKVDGQRDVFTVTVRDAAKSLEGAREAGRYEATKYCIKNYGSSDITWVVGPDTPAQNLAVVDGSLVFQGACPS